MLIVINNYNGLNYGFINRDTKDWGMNFWGTADLIECVAYNM